MYVRQITIYTLLEKQQDTGYMVYMMVCLGTWIFCSDILDKYWTRLLSRIHA